MTDHLIPELRLASSGFAANALWEALQTPLYADRGGGALYLIRTRLHCAVGDILILIGCFAVVALFWRDRHWIENHSLPPRILFVTLGLAYTAASEILNTRWSQSWTYAPEMPLLFGVGLAPILQWALVPSVLLVLLGRRKGLKRSGGSPIERESRLVFDPVCGSRIEPEGANQFFDGEKTVYFCSVECRRTHIARFRDGGAV